VTTELDDFLGEPRRGCLTCRLPQEIIDVIQENECRPRHLRHGRIKVAEWVASKGHKTTADSIYKLFSSYH
jgi:hypothetical protein